MIENGVLVDLDGSPLFWHTPPGRSVACLPDSLDLWQQFWNNRNNISGFAHSHPGGGIPSPSWTDITTFSAIELGLGIRLLWWIISFENVVVCRWAGKDKYDYNVELVSSDTLVWVDNLKLLSYKL